MRRLIMRGKLKKEKWKGEKEGEMNRVSERGGTEKLNNWIEHGTLFYIP